MFSEIMRCCKALTYQQMQIQQEVAIWNKVLEEIHAQVKQRLIIDEDELLPGHSRCQGSQLKEIERSGREIESSRGYEKASFVSFFPFEQVLYFISLLSLHT